MNIDFLLRTFNKNTAFDYLKKKKKKKTYEIIH